MDTPAQKLAQRRRWSLQQLATCASRLTECRDIAAKLDPEHLGLLAIQDAMAFVARAIKEIKKQQGVWFYSGKQDKESTE